MTEIPDWRGGEGPRQTPTINPKEHTVKKLTLIALLTAIALPAVAGHVPNGWRDTGCDEAANVEIIGKNGNVLYLNNPTCPNGQGGMDPVAADEPEVIVPDEDEEVAEEPGEDEPVEEVVAALD